MLAAGLPDLLGAEGPTFVTLFVRPFTWADPGTRRRTADAVAELTAALGTPS